MKTYDVECPYCGKLNRGIFLEETKGWMECIYCETLSRTANADGREKMFVRVIPSLQIAVSR